MEIKILNVPEKAEADVRKMALVAVRRYLEREILKIDEAKITDFNTQLQSFIDANKIIL